MEDKERLIKVEEKIKVHEDKMKEHDEAIKELRKTYSLMEKMSYRIENMQQTMGSINEKLEKHEIKINEEANREDHKNGTKWTKLIDYLFYVILAYALIKIGLK